MGFESFGMLIAGAAITSLAFYMVKFVVEVGMGKYKTEK